MTPTLLVICLGTCFLKPGNDLLKTTAGKITPRKDQTAIVFPSLWWYKWPVRYYMSGSPITSLASSSSTFVFAHPRSCTGSLLFFQRGRHICSLELQNWLFALPVTFLPQINAPLTTSFSLHLDIKGESTGLCQETKIKIDEMVEIRTET